MPVKFNVYIEELIKADQDRRLMAAPAAPPPPVVEAQAELLEHLRNKSSQLDCECACLLAACTSPLLIPQQVRCTGVLSSGSQLGWCVGWMGGWASLGWYGNCESDGACERSAVCECPIAVFHTLKSERKVTNPKTGLSFIFSRPKCAETCSFDCSVYLQSQKFCKVG